MNATTAKNAPTTAETLEQAAMVHGNDVDVLVEQLNEVYLEK